MSRGKLSITVQCGIDLKDTEKNWISEQDPYYILTLEKQRFKSKVAKDAGKKPVWNQEAVFLVNKVTQIHIEVWNKNITADKIIGQGTYDLANVMRAGVEQCQLPIYSKNKSAGILIIDAKFTCGSNKPTSHAPSRIQQSHQYHSSAQMGSQTRPTHISTAGHYPSAYYPSAGGAPQPNTSTSGYPPPQTAQATYPPAQVPSYPPAQAPTASYPPAQSQGYPPTQGTQHAAQGSYPPTQGAYPPTQGSYPPTQGSYPPTQGAYPPTQGTYPPAQGAYPPAQGAYPTAQGAYPPTGSSYPSQQQQSKTNSSGALGGLTGAALTAVAAAHFSSGYSQPAYDTPPANPTSQPSPYGAPPPTQQSYGAPSGYPPQPPQHNAPPSQQSTLYSQPPSQAHHPAGHQVNPHQHQHQHQQPPTHANPYQPQPHNPYGSSSGPSPQSHGVHTYAGAPPAGYPTGHSAPTQPKPRLGLGSGMGSGMAYASGSKPGGKMPGGKLGKYMLPIAAGMGALYVGSKIMPKFDMDFGGSDFGDCGGWGSD